MCKRCKCKSSTPHHLHQCLGCWEEVFILSTPFILDCLSCWPTSCWDPSAKSFPSAHIKSDLTSIPLSCFDSFNPVSLKYSGYVKAQKKTLVRVQKKTMFWLKIVVFFPRTGNSWKVDFGSSTVTPPPSCPPLDMKAADIDIMQMWY